MSEWVVSWQEGLEFVAHLDGVPWYEAPAPQRRHQCQPQTRGWMDRAWVERCACGGTRLDERSHWMTRGERLNLSRPGRWWHAFTRAVKARVA